MATAAEDCGSWNNTLTARSDYISKRKRPMLFVAYGRTRVGKSTTLNKLFGLEVPTCEDLGQLVKAKQLEVLDNLPFAVHRSDLKTSGSTTKTPLLVRTDKCILLDTPGLGDSDDAARDAFNNEEDMKRVIDILRCCDVASKSFEGGGIDYLLYFVPSGMNVADDKVHRELQLFKQLQASHGSEEAHNIWNRILIVVTHGPYAPDEKSKAYYLRTVRKTIVDGLASQKIKAPWSDEFPPPACLLPADATAADAQHILATAIRSSSHSGSQLMFGPAYTLPPALQHTCIKCGWTEDTRVQRLLGKSEGSCHPGFAQKYDGVEKFVGGIIHLLLGLGFILGLPGWTNNDEVCTACGKQRGAKGCKHDAKHCFLAPYQVHEDFVEERAGPA